MIYQGTGENKPIESQYQTPKYVCRYMVSLIPDNVRTVLEPTPGMGNIVKQLNNKYEVIAPGNYFEWRSHNVDCVVMNTPFTHKEMNFEGAPDNVKRLKGIKINIYFLYRAIDLSDNIIALIPWYTIINSKKRVMNFMRFGMVSITNLGRNAFPHVRVQTCILHLKKGWTEQIVFKQL